ncbi:Zinc/iron permease [Podospora aff. communis PSN243]|uniref:Zinc/iron permease n=1 Tax=Podospora aff. communis PSN243 TaxID=3040156 RepID=A0AAV9GGC9_9PEZI|nr:Zinc/iron permease [Podospora aff. communis PSN243]
MAEITDSQTEFNPSRVDLDVADLRDVVCYMTAGGNDFDGQVGARISAIFVLLATSTFTTLFPVLAARVPRLRIPRHIYLFARYFGAGVIIATAFIHLLDPAYDKIGPASCVGLSAGWSEYSWPPAIAMTSVMLIFLLDFGAEWYVEQKYGFAHADVEGAVTTSHPHSPTASVGRKQTIVGNGDDMGDETKSMKSLDISPGMRTQPTCSHQFLHSGEQDEQHTQECIEPYDSTKTATTHNLNNTENSKIENIWGVANAERVFRQQIVAFTILEFGVIFHSAIIGLNLGVVGQEFSTLYPVIVFHQAFEGLGIGARLSMIPFPKRYSWLPWTLCAAYGLTTPIAVAIGLGLANTYDAGSFVARVVSGVLDSISAGILLYTGLVELLARDFLFNPDRSRKTGDIVYMLVCLFLGIIVMALLGKWA